MALIQTLQASTTAAGTSRAGTWGSNTTTGNTIIVAVAPAVAANNVTSITDSQGNTYVHDVRNTAGAGSHPQIEIWHAENITGGTTPTITVNWTNSTNCAWIAREYSGLATSSTLDKTAGSSGTNNAPSSGATATTSQNDELVIGAVSYPTTTVTMTAGSGYANASQKGSTGAGTSSLVAVEDKTVAATGAQTATFSSSETGNNWNCVVATFKVAGGGGGGPVAGTKGSSAIFLG